VLLNPEARSLVHMNPNQRKAKRSHNIEKLILQEQRFGSVFIDVTVGFVALLALALALLECLLVDKGAWLHKICVVHLPVRLLNPSRKDSVL
jgi:hypothetical protein